MTIVIKHRSYLFTFCLILITHFSQAQYWQPVAGLIPNAKFTGITSLISSPSIVVTTVNSGIYRSADAGNTWQQVLVTTDSIFSLIDLDGKYFCAGGSGFTYTSSDSGVTWTSHVFPFHVPVGRLAFHPGGVLIAGTGSKWDLNGNGGKGVWMSNDSGQTWSSINAGIAMQNPLIESLAVTSSGTIIAGLFDANAGLGGKYGLMKLDSFSGSWQRISITVDAPFNQTYTDQNLRIESVFNINILDGQVITSIEGTYINFGYAFTIQKALNDINDLTIAWKVKWVVDSIPSTGSFYEHIVNLFKDSHDTIWASVSQPANEIDNNIFTGDLVNDVAWDMNMDSISQQTGRFLFSEASGERLYAVSYFTGSQVFVRSISGTTALPEIENNLNSVFSIFPNPVKNNFTISFNKNLKDICLKIFDGSGRSVYLENLSDKENINKTFELNLNPGLYLVNVSNGNETWSKKIIQE
jgi:hypothetical protein